MPPTDPLEPLRLILKAFEDGFSDAFAKADDAQKAVLKQQLAALRHAYWTARAESFDAGSAAFAAISADMRNVNQALAAQLQSLQDIAGLIQVGTQAVQLATALVGLVAPVPGARAFAGAARAGRRGGARAPAQQVLRVLCVHGVGDHHTDTSWEGIWRAAIQGAVNRWDSSMLVTCDFPLYDDIFEDHRFELNPTRYAEAVARLTASGVMVGIHNVEDKIGQAISAIGGTIDSWLHTGRGLADLPNELRWTAGMVAQWADFEDLRSACRKRISDAIIAAQKAGAGYDLVLAHSLGSLICYDAFTHDQNLMSNRALGVFGSQIGNPFVRGCFGGYLVGLKNARQWFQLFNPNDRAFTAEIRLTTDEKFRRLSTPFVDGFLSHDAVKYLTHEQAVSGLWYEVVSGRAPSRAFRPMSQALSAFQETLTTAARDRDARPVRGRYKPNRRALLVGINEYPNPENRLEGCVNDVFLISAALQESNFNPEDIRVVFDDRATAAGIYDRLHWLLDGTRAGDERVFFYSGHGAQIPGYGPDLEVDHLNECLVPWDFDWTEQRAITDKQFVSLYSQLPYDSQFVAIFDCCHAGGMTRESGAKVRGINPPDDVRHRALCWDSSEEMWVPRDFRKKEQKVPISEEHGRDKAFVGESRVSYRLGRGTLLRVLKDERKRRQRRILDTAGPFMPTIIEACQEEELSYEYRHGVTSYGAFTFSMTKELRDARRDRSKRRITFAELIKRTSKRLRDLNYAQSPCLTQPSAHAKDLIPWHSTTPPAAKSG